MIKHTTKYLLIFCLFTSSFTYSGPLNALTLKNSSLYGASLLWSYKDKILMAGLLVGSGYLAILNFVRAAKFRTKKEALQNSIPFLKQCINDLKQRVIKKQILLGDEWYVYIVYDKVYDELLNHDSIEYKRLKKYYAQEKSYSRTAALSVIVSVLCGMRLIALYKEQ